MPRPVEQQLKLYIPKPSLGKDSFKEGQIRADNIHLDGIAYPHLVTADFPPEDPWSQFMGKAIDNIRVAGRFKGAQVNEFGIGDGRNLRRAGEEVRSAIGVDVDEWRLRAAAINLVTGDKPLSAPVELWHGDASEYVKKYREIRGGNIAGWVIMCLPQSPEGVNFADTYNGSEALDPYRAEWQSSGLTLNAAVLDNLRKVADAQLRTLIIISDRVPETTREKLFQKTGWDIDQQVRTKNPIQQDPDTGIHWVEAIDDGRRFYEKVGPEQYRPISAVEAEKRRQASLASGLGREELNAHHHLTIYELKAR